MLKRQNTSPLMRTKKYPPIKSRTQWNRKLKKFRIILCWQEKKIYNTYSQAWTACCWLHHIWKSDISNKTKTASFKLYVENILLSGLETWTIKKQLQDRLNGTYTCLLMKIKNIAWCQQNNRTWNIWQNAFNLHCCKPKESKFCWTLLQIQRSSQIRCTVPVILIFQLRKMTISYLDGIIRDTVLKICKHKWKLGKCDRMLWRHVWLCLDKLQQVFHALSHEIS